MPGLIEEIQRDATSNNIPIESLLRRVKLAAAKLKLSSIEGWVDEELKGYSGEVPAYRIIHGQPAAWNPFNGWIPVQAGEPWMIEKLSTAYIGQSISSIRDISERNNGSLHFPIYPEIVNLINKISNFHTARMVIQIPAASMVGILDAVRNRVLDWSIEMERNDVIGEGMSFNAREVHAARSVMNNFHIGKIDNFAGNMGSENVSGDISITQSKSAEIHHILDNLRRHADDLVQVGADRNLPNIIDNAIAEVSKPSPDRGRMSGLIQDARSALAGAAGNLTAEGALALLAAATKLLGG